MEGEHDVVLGETMKLLVNMMMLLIVCTGCVSRTGAGVDRVALAKETLRARSRLLERRIEERMRATEDPRMQSQDKAIDFVLIVF